METQGGQADTLGGFLCSLTSGILLVEIPHIRHLAFMPNGTDSVSFFPRNNVDLIRSRRWKKLVFHPELINQDLFNLFPKTVGFCSVSLRMHKENLCFNFSESLISKFSHGALRRGDSQI